MNRLTASLVALYLTLTSLTSPTALTSRRHRPDERGSVTIENVMWAVAVIGFVTIVAAAIRSLVVSQAGNIAP